MHELSLLRELMEVVDAEVRRYEARGVARIRLRVGDMSGVDADALRFAFPCAARGTVAEGAELELERAPVVARCSACGIDFEPPDVIYTCPRCGALSGELRQGADLTLVSLELLESEPAHVDHDAR